MRLLTLGICITTTNGAWHEGKVLLCYTNQKEHNLSDGMRARVVVDTEYGSWSRTYNHLTKNPCELKHPLRVCSHPTQNASLVRSADEVPSS